MSIPPSLSRRAILRAFGIGAGATATAALASACASETTPAESGTGDPIADGINKFEDSTYPGSKDVYTGLADSQSPHTLVISCSDSRIDTETILSAGPGELFHLRDIANIVPHADNPDMGALAPIEYAVVAVGVSNIALFGHSNCGGMAALQHLEEYKEKVPATYEWLTRSESVLANLDADPAAEDYSLKLEQANAAAQVDNLMSHKFIADRVNAGDLKIEIFHYDIGKGDVTTLDQEKNVFVDI